MHSIAVRDCAVICSKVRMMSVMYYRNVEKRKEKSRDAARSRRGKEGILFTELTDLLPLPSATKLQLDKATVTRIAISHVKLSSLLGRGTYESN